MITPVVLVPFVPSLCALRLKKMPKSQKANQLVLITGATLY